MEFFLVLIVILLWQISWNCLSPEEKQAHNEYKASMRHMRKLSRGPTNVRELEELISFLDEAFSKADVKG